MRISDWSSDVCSSDLAAAHRALLPLPLVPAGSRLRLRAERPHRGGPGGGSAGRARSGGDAERQRQGPENRPLPALPPCIMEQLRRVRSEEHTSELQSLMRISYAGFCLKKKKNNKHT